MLNDSITALNIMKQYTGVAIDNKQWDDTFNILLEKAKTPAFYRPWICAAFHLWSMSSGADRAMLKTADGATWLTPEELTSTIRGLLTTQDAMDGSALDIPEGWGIGENRVKLCGCSVEEEATSNLVTGFVV